ncbi:MAG: thioredoxin family protein [Candidatus Lokiarchaeota archaeon]|nr:thioredoxin family protein [Candidatus Lokiarchaeota archaeon]
MNDKSVLKWNDLVSPTMTPEEYLKEYGDKIESNYKTYEPNEDVIKKIKEILKNKNEKLKIVSLGADWCPDCNRNVPRMIKIIEFMESNDVDLKILYGIMVDALHKKNEAIWHKKRSPPEAIDPKFNLKKIPTFYFFKADDELIGTIVENPKWESTLEEDLLEILKNKL